MFHIKKNWLKLSRCCRTKTCFKTIQNYVRLKFPYGIKFHQNVCFKFKKNHRAQLIIEENILQGFSIIMFSHLTAVSILESVD